MTDTITVKKELLINLGNFSSVKITAEITTEDSFDEAWRKLNSQIAEQETLEKSMRLPKTAGVTNSKIF